MAALPSRVAFGVEANTAIASGTNRIADLPGNLFRLFVLLRDVLSVAGNGRPKICELRAQETDDVAVTTGSEFLKDFLNENALGREAVEELGLVEEDLLHIVDLVCGTGGEPLRSALLGTASEPASVAQESAGGPVAPSGKVTSAKKKGGFRGS